MNYDYPTGASFIEPYIPWTSGKRFYVGSEHPLSGDGNSGLSLDDPFATFNKAMDAVTASKGDQIILLPGHTEAITGAAGISADVAGVSVIGIGHGSLQPTFTFGAAAATFVISAANTSFVNVGFKANFADVAIGLDISAVDGLSFIGCNFTEAGANLNFVITVDLATGADNVTFKSCKFIGADASNDTFINGVAHDGLYISDCYFAMNVAQTSVVGLIATTGNATNVVIKDCHFRSNIDGAKFIICGGAANGGLISNCYFSSIDGAGAVTAGFDFTGGHIFECYVAGEADSFGLIGGGTVYNNA